MLPRLDGAPRLSSPAARLALIAIAGVAGFAAVVVPALPQLTPIQPAMEMATFFFVAAAMRLGLPSRWFQIVPSLAALLGWVVIATFLPWLTWPLAWPMLTYAAVGIGAANLPVLRRAGRFGDFSYGLYLWAYPVQQVVVGATEIDSLPLNIILVSLITLLFAVASWHLVEKRALALKDAVLPSRKPVTTEPA